MEDMFEELGFDGEDEAPEDAEHYGLLEPDGDGVVERSNSWASAEALLERDDVRDRAHLRRAAEAFPALSDDEWLITASWRLSDGQILVREWEFMEHATEDYPEAAIEEAIERTRDGDIPI